MTMCGRGHHGVHARLAVRTPRHPRPPRMAGAPRPPTCHCGSARAAPRPASASGRANHCDSPSAPAPPRLRHHPGRAPRVGQQDDEMIAAARIASRCARQVRTCPPRGSASTSSTPGTAAQRDVKARAPPASASPSRSVADRLDRGPRHDDVAEPVRGAHEQVHIILFQLRGAGREHAGAPRDAARRASAGAPQPEVG